MILLSHSYLGGPCANPTITRGLASGNKKIQVQIWAPKAILRLGYAIGYSVIRATLTHIVEAPSSNGYSSQELYPDRQ